MNALRILLCSVLLLIATAPLMAQGYVLLKFRYHGADIVSGGLDVIRRCGADVRVT